VNVWTLPALRAEIEYRHEEMRRAFGSRRRRWGRRVAAEPQQPPAAPRIPRQRTAGPGEQRVPVGCAAGADR
jgi:hypothetical protein